MTDTCCEHERVWLWSAYMPEVDLCAEHKRERAAGVKLAKKLRRSVSRLEARMEAEKSA